ncbi:MULTISPECIES: hypothetical protein [Calothrix]|uniref:Uncharacterized protein n=2 Tax=Calothrix TaxID=1186 RepID=A0ABR8A385_9CYAN|nr:MULTISPECIES: hypothetical protein [Calothrix]MBD2194029.1 hypothetical protein [Calothrix parietina FACHB-288]MBD2204269.1 hypothetical protein [Calothrix sp. FACHB-168]MBD2220575.1 hypothetical protein [Calothrix sp. FACHB-1219]MBD2223036.1 hypothetical protein [Calothrix anomala FACHB-343]
MEQYSQQVLLDCVVEDSESAKQKTTEWQTGSAIARFGVNHHFGWGCQD